MAVLTTAPATRVALAEAVADPARITVVAFCAAWCDTCAQFRATYERIAAARSQASFVWLDIEDDEAVAGDVEVENFPTLAIYHGAVPLFFGISLPHELTVARLCDAYAASRVPMTDPPAAVSALPGLLAAKG